MTPNLMQVLLSHDNLQVPPDVWEVTLTIPFLGCIYIEMSRQKRMTLRCAQKIAQ